jgi:hypothetical protein
MPKKKGKSALAACEAVYALLPDDPSPEVYSCSGDYDQARIYFPLDGEDDSAEPESAATVPVFGAFWQLAQGITVPLGSKLLRSRRGSSPGAPLYLANAAQSRRCKRRYVRQLAGDLLQSFKRDTLPKRFIPERL